MHKISRQKTIEGTRVPGIICNDQYFYINLDVYEDGMINCWELVDLIGLKEKLRINWLVPSIPKGKTISIHGLGLYQIQSANWKYNKSSYYSYIEETIKRLNPNLDNIYKITKDEAALMESRQVFYNPEAIDFYVKNELFYQKVEGTGSTIFMKYNSNCYLVNLVIYKDGHVTCYNSEFELHLELADVEDYLSNGTFFTSFDSPTTVIFDNFAEVILSEVVYAVDSDEKYKEILDTHSNLNGEQTSLEKCRQAYYQYLENPSHFSRLRLKELYELIPEHERIYLGDMDSKDKDYTRIIYNPESKREV